MSLISSITLELLKALLAGATAATVFVFGQAVQRFYFEPLSELRKLIGQIATDLVYYRNRFSAPDTIHDQDWREATGAYRKHASCLRSLPLAIPFFDWIALAFGLPSRKEMHEASSQLIGLSNMSRNPTHDDFVWKNMQFEDVHRLLRIPKD